MAPSNRRSSSSGGGLFCAVALSIFPLRLPAWAEAPDSQRPPAIRFSTDLDAALADARQGRVPLVLVFGAAWCPNCQRIARTTFAAPEVLSLAERFRWVYIDIDRDLTLARSYEVEAIPHVSLLDPQGNQRVRMIGAVRPSDFRAYLEDFLKEGEGEAGRVSTVTVLRENNPHQTSLIFPPKGYRGLSICFSHVGYGPLRLKSQSPFQSLRLSLVPRTPSTLARGQIEVRTAGTWSNVFATGEKRNLDFHLDYETLDASVSLGYGILDVLQLEVEFEDRSRFGGAMDGFIQGFHRAFGIDQGGRDEVPRNDFRFELRPKDGRPPVSLTKDDRGSFSRNLLVTLQHNVTCGSATWPAFSYSVTSRFELTGGGDLQGGSPVDLGVSVAASRRFGKFYGYLTLAVSRFGRNSFRGIELRKNQFSGLAALEWRYRPTKSFVLQYLLSEGTARDLASFSTSSKELKLGWKGEIGKGTVLEVGLIENVITLDNSPDFGVHVGLSSRF